MDECIDEEQGHYILKLFSPRRQNDILHLRAKKCKMRHILLGSFIFILPPLARSRKIDAKLGVSEKFEYPKFGAKEHRDPGEDEASSPTSKPPAARPAAPSTSSARRELRRPAAISARISAPTSVQQPPTTTSPVSELGKQARFLT
ncbi:hypothetical protein H5410_021270 [Solanum commersonii]|uniref:Uncharacterized protein n=1 Tax=Solanum commersonii TaxID=4109 RepID=A0A9J5ZC54_SOLCO|nr:hypothetical protein H5410_021270 [Solanum commersonii]